MYIGHELMKHVHLYKVRRLSLFLVLQVIFFRAAHRSSRLLYWHFVAFLFQTHRIHLNLAVVMTRCTYIIEPSI